METATQSTTHIDQDSFPVGRQQTSTTIVCSHSFKLHVTSLYPKRSNVVVICASDGSEWWARLPESTGWFVAALKHKGENVLLKVFPSQMGKAQSRFLAKLKRWAEKEQGGGLAWLDLQWGNSTWKMERKKGRKASSGLNSQHAFQCFGPTWVLLSATQNIIKSTIPSKFSKTSPLHPGTTVLLIPCIWSLNNWSN